MGMRASEMGSKSKGEETLFPSGKAQKEPHRLKAQMRGSVKAIPRVYILRHEGLDRVKCLIAGAIKNELDNA